MHSRPEDHGPLFVPDDFTRRYGADARRRVAHSRRPPFARRARGTPWARVSGSQRAFRLLLVLHGLAATLILLAMLATGTWLEGAVLLGILAATFVGVVGLVRLVMRMDRDRDDTPSTRRPGPAVWP
jgi:hypothetical protein